ncbi:50S ribosomal protein L9 [Candidatus Kaiserbacteria bacterium RIFOXYD1_FULL_42_15]|uniref:Large ribosomal subunit protein bL9 n=1 Tax=Candidatus Kaiserbacteria bacterium RIFOXYD1_FULL_42_15 TaxID=1798532 RepID=A0A1F6FQG8_9BACT|nr:MAG: 50S ribosomal protein L9 [Candidatus Kaiserbacteria bacterium RIFOXYD1_FULL_42_15]
MKVILLRDVAKLGKRFELTTVPDGYALNKLIPQGLAEASTPENVKRVLARKDKQIIDSATQIEVFLSACEALKESTITLAVEANEQQHLFKAVKESDVARALADAGYAISTDLIKLAEPIKALGVYEVAIQLADKHGLVKLEVIKK